MVDQALVPSLEVRRMGDGHQLGAGETGAEGPSRQLLAGGDQLFADQEAEVEPVRLHTPLTDPVQHGVEHGRPAVLEVTPTDAGDEQDVPG